MAVKHELREVRWANVTEIMLVRALCPSSGAGVPAGGAQRQPDDPETGPRASLEVTFMCCRLG